MTEVGNVRWLPVGSRGVDYADARPSPQSIADAGYSFACRYLNYGLRVPAWPKSLTLAEAHALSAAGVVIGPNWEASQGDPLKGGPEGTLHGTLARQAAEALGIPRTVPIRVSTDTNVSQGNWAVLDAYHHAFVLASGWPILVYAESDYMDHLAAIGLCRGDWWPAASSWSSGRISPLVAIRQRVGTVLGGTSDANVLLAPAPFWSLSAQSPPEPSPAPPAPVWTPPAPFSRPARNRAHLLAA